MRGASIPEIRMMLLRQRQACRMGQRELAELMGTTQSAISELETGQYDPQLGTLRKWAEALGLTVTITVGVNVSEDL